MKISMCISTDGLQLVITHESRNGRLGHVDLGEFDKGVNTVAN